jgi:kynurenine formamidase
MGQRRFIELSMEVYKGMVIYPGVVPPYIAEYYTHEEYAKVTGTDKLGIVHCNNGIIVMGDHVGTHMDSWFHANPDAPGAAEAIPLEYCYGDGVVLDMTHKGPGDEITDVDLQGGLRKIGYTLKPLDIVLVRTDASKKRFSPDYLKDHPGMTREGVIWLLDQGVMLIGIDAIGFDPPIEYMFKRGKLWEAHRVMREREYYHIENLINLDLIPMPYGFTISAFPVKLRGATAAPIRAVAIIEE